jgi:outer membrane protein OmpA-like peptidoglycan-associated protein
MKVKLFLIAVMLMWSFQKVVAQDPKNPQTPQYQKKLVKYKIDPNSPKGISLKETKEGDKTFEMKGLALGEALKHYLNAYKFDSINPSLNYKIGVCYLNTINKVRSIPYLEKAYKIKPNINRDILFLLGLAYQLNYEWDKAISEFEKYQLTLSPELKEAMSGEIAKHIEECGNGKWLMQHPVSVTIENLGAVVNSIFPEFGPFLTADESKMFFTARKDNTIGNGIDENDYEFFEDIYVTEKENGNWGAPKNMGYPVNSDTHDGAAGLSSDGQRLFVYRGDIKGGDLFESKLNGFEWTEPVSLGKQINTKYHEASACLSGDQKTLYFVSDRPDLSYGGSDIFLSHLDKKGKWGPPENLGSVINTPYDEDGIFLHADGKTLFFSSKGHETMGGYDIFWSKYNDSTGIWSKPENIGYPINSPDDDVFFVLSANGEKGYYSSVKNNGYGEKDIYMISFGGGKKTFPDSVNCVINITPITLVKGRVLDAKTLLPLQASIEIVDNVNALTISTLQSNSETGKFLVTLPCGRNYGTYVSAPGYLFHSENFDIPVMKEYQEIGLEILLDKIEAGKKILLNNIFYDFDKASLRLESTYELERLTKLMNEYPTIKIEIASHTDSIGTNEYNQILSNARAKSVVDWLTTHGIDVSRLVYKGYGETEPAASNKTSEGRQLNRRTEFRILSK